MSPAAVAEAEKVDTAPLLRRAAATAATIAELEGKLEGLYTKRTRLFESMREAGMTNRAIGDAVGLSEPAVRKALRKAAEQA